MNRTKRFIYNSLSTGIYQIITLVIGFIVPRIMLVHYGSEINGVVSSIGQIVMYLQLLEAGLSAAAIYALYKPLATNDTHQINRVVAASRKSYNKVGFIFLLILVALAIIYPYLVPVEELRYIETILLVMAIGFSGALEFFTLARYRVILEADQKTYVISIASTVGTISNFIIILIAVYMDASIVILKYFALTSVIARTTLLYLYTRKHYKYLYQNDIKENNFKIEKRGDAFYNQLMNMIYQGAPVIIATSFLNLRMVSVYTVYNLVIFGLHRLFYILSNGVTATFGELIATNQQDKLKRTYNIFQYVFFSAIGIVFSITAVMYFPFIKIYTAGVTDVNYLVLEYAIFFTIKGIFETIKTPLRMLVVAAGKYRETRTATTVEIIILLVLSIGLVKPLGIVGILIGTIAAELYMCIVLLLFVSKVVTYESPQTYIMRIIRILITVIIVFLFANLFEIDPINYYEWGLYAIGVGAIAVITTLCLSLLFEIKTLKELYNRVLALYHQFRNRKL